MQCSLDLLSSEMFSYEADTGFHLKLKEFAAESFILPPAEAESTVSLFA
jgi:hypothetical protein